ncbi:hypothetical protein D9M68_755070 [compost metagenome]
MAESTQSEAELRSLEQLHASTDGDEYQRLEAAADHHHGSPDPGIHGRPFHQRSLVGEPKPDPQRHRSDRSADPEHQRGRWRPLDLDNALAIDKEQPERSQRKWNLKQAPGNPTVDIPADGQHNGH